MTKAIKIVRRKIENEDYYCFLNEKDEVIFNVQCSTKTIKGKDLYEKVYQTKENDVIEVKINQDELTSEDKKCFGNYVIDLFKSIDDSMKKQFADKKE